MTKIRKKLTLALGVALLSCLIPAGGASAAEFHLAAAPATVTGNQSTLLVLTTTAGTITCKTATFSATQLSKTAAEQVTSWTLKECTAFGFINVPIDWNGCFFKFASSGSAQITCPGGKPIEVTAPGCTTLIGGQSLPGGATYTTSGSTPNRHIIEHWNFSGLSYIECGTARTNGTWKGSTTTKASSGEYWFE